MSAMHEQAIAVPPARYLVTGGCGFIGSHIAEALVRQGHEVRVLDNLSTGHLHNIAAFRDRVDFVEGDLRDRDAVRRATAGIGIIFHEAALVSVPASVERPDENHAINLTGTLNLLDAARSSGAKRIVFASTAAVYGNAPKLPKSEGDALQPETPYAIAKLAGEHYLRIFAHLYGLEAVSLRYFNVYGPRQDPRSPYSGVISRFVDALSRGASPTIYGDGRQTRDFVYVADVVQANLRAALIPSARGEAFNIATGQGASLLQLLSTMGAVSGRSLAPRHEPARAGDILHSVAAIAHARESLGYAPRYSLTEGLTVLLRSLSFPP
jgi:UDP-glucose 4-epimerase